MYCTYTLYIACTVQLLEHVYLELGVDITDHPDVRNSTTISDKL